MFRTVMYPMNGPAGGGLLRLHSTYRHDLKIYSSDEGRVQMSAAAFTQGLLDLEGASLTPILVRQGPLQLQSPKLSVAAELTPPVLIRLHSTLLQGRFWPWPLLVVARSIENGDLVLPLKVGSGRI